MADSTCVYPDDVQQQLVFARSAIFSIRQGLQTIPDLNDEYIHALWRVELDLENLEAQITARPEAGGEVSHG